MWGKDWRIAAPPGVILVFAIGNSSINVKERYLLAASVYLVAESIFVNNMRLVSSSESVFDASGEGKFNSLNASVNI